MLPNIRYYLGICLKALKKKLETLQTGQRISRPRFESVISQIGSRSANKLGRDVRCTETITKVSKTPVRKVLTTALIV